MRNKHAQNVRRRVLTISVQDIPEYDPLTRAYVPRTTKPHFYEGHRQRSVPFSNVVKLRIKTSTPDLKL
jgi:hypothetical protein